MAQAGHGMSTMAMTRFPIGNNSSNQIVVASAGYSIGQLLQNLGLQVNRPLCATCLLPCGPHDTDWRQIVALQMLCKQAASVSPASTDTQHGTLPMRLGAVCLLAHASQCLQHYKMQYSSSGTAGCFMHVVASVMLCILQAYIMLFDNQNVRLETLLTMKHDDLEELGIRSFGHRKAIMQGLQTYLQMYLRSCEMAVDGHSML